MQLLFRADGGAEIGNGHLLRCLGLAQYFLDLGARPVLATATPAASAVVMWRDEGLPVRLVSGAAGSDADAELTRSLAQGVGADWIVLDGYSFSRTYQARLARAAKVCVFDDLGEGDTAAHVLINQNAAADRWARYRSPAECRQLLGPRYAVLRRELRTLQRKPPGDVPRVLVTFGGADSRNFALRAMVEVARLSEPFQTVAICTAGPPGYAEAEDFVRGHADRFRVVLPGPTTGHLAEADIAICAGGTTSLECAALGVAPIIIVTAHNQRRGAQGLEAAGAARLVGEGEAAMSKLAAAVGPVLASAAKRDALARAGQRLVSRDGVAHIVEAMREVSGVLD